MSNKPLVSIIIPVYNGSAYVREAIDSALAQTYQNIEIIVVNDGSTDGGKTDEAVAPYGDKIKYYVKPNGGVSSALNFGISKMQGEYFSWLSHDDKYTPEKIERQINAILKYEGCKVVGLCEHIFIDSSSQVISNLKTEVHFSEEYVCTNDALAVMFKKGTYDGCSFLIPRTAFEECGGFDEDLRYSQDMLKWAELFLSGYSVVYDSYEGVMSRIHGAQQIQTARHLIAHDSAIIAEKIASDLAALENKNILYYFARRNAKYGNSEAVKTCRQKGRFGLKKRFSLGIISFYAKLRPVIRKIYYRIFVKVKTK